MFTGFLIAAIVGLLGVLTHRRSRFEQRVFKNVPLSEWIIVLVVPVFMYLGWAVVVNNIIDRPRMRIIPFDDFNIIAVTALFMVYGFVGNSMHFTSKVLWRYLKDQKKSMAYRVNEMFHGKLSHYLIFLNVLFIIFLLSITEINHPVSGGVTKLYLAMTALCGVIFGVSAVRTVFYPDEWFGGYNKPLFFVYLGLFLVQFSLFKVYNLSFYNYPVSMFVAYTFMTGIVAFTAQQLGILSRLDAKRRIKYLVRIIRE